MKMRKGFTLIELIIVLAIIGILLVIMVPAYKGYVKKKKENDIVTKEYRTRDNSQREYIDNTRRDNTTKVEIKTHNDGTKYACIIGEDKCYKVK